MTIDEIFGKHDCKRILHVDVEIRMRSRNQTYELKTQS